MSAMSSLQILELDVARIIGECTVHDKENTQLPELIRLKKKIRFLSNRTKNEKVGNVNNRSAVLFTTDQIAKLEASL